MYFDFRTFANQKLYAMTHGAGTGPWLLTACQVCVYPLVHLGLVVDDWCHTGIATTAIERPVFIVSSPRSGSTLLLQLFAGDPLTACFSTRELLLPSPTLCRSLPPPLVAWADALFRRRFAPLAPIHPLRFEQPEEDELLFLLLGNSGISAYLFPYGPELDRLAVSRFWEWPAWKRERFGRFYQRCLQRLLWVRGVRRYVGKSPHFLGKIDDLRCWFSDARFIYLVRSPYEWVPSALSMLTAFWGLATRRPAPAAARETAYRAFVELAAQGDRALQRMPRGSVLTVRYPELIADPAGTVARLYAQLGWPLSPTDTERLARGREWQRAWRSPHHYALGSFGLTQARIRRDFGFVFDRFELDQELPADGAQGAA